MQSSAAQPRSIALLACFIIIIVEIYTDPGRRSFYQRRGIVIVNSVATPLGHFL